jgi:predicted transcriptional regulator
MQLKPLSPAEWRLFNLVLSCEDPDGATVEWVRARVIPKRSPSTIATLLTRVREKGWVRTEDGGSRDPALRFFPLVTADVALSKLVDHLLREYELSPAKLSAALKATSNPKK